MHPKQGFHNKKAIQFYFEVSGISGISSNAWALVSIGMQHMFVAPRPADAKNS